MSGIRLEWNGGGMAVISAVWTLVNSARESQVPMMFSFAGKNQDVFFPPKHNPRKGHGVVTP